MAVSLHLTEQTIESILRQFASFTCLH